MAVTWIKRKYTCDKPVKKNGAAGDHQGGKKRRKTGINVYIRENHVMVLSADQKIRWRHTK
jgi:hypothetical protein